MGPEVETPGHVQVMTHAMKERITQECFNPDVVQQWDGPLDPTSETMYEWLEEFLKEIASIFPNSRKLHLGNDEVNFECWMSNNNTNAWMADHDMTTYDELQTHFINRLLKIAKSVKREDGSQQWDRIGIWEDPVSNADQPVPEDRDLTIFEWLGYNTEKYKRWFSQGFEVIRNDCWYLDYISYGETEWKKYRDCPL